MDRRLLIAIACAGLSVMIGSGIRQSFGLFLQPISDALGTGREIFSLAVGINTIVFGLPLAGFLSDWIGSRIVLLGGGLLFSVGLLLLSVVQSPALLYLSMGLMIGVGLSAASYVVVLGAVGQMVKAEHRSRTFGLITAMGSSGMFVIPPLAELFIARFDWQFALILLAFVSATILIFAFGLPKQSIDPSSAANVEASFTRMLQRAGRHSGFLLLVTGFFVCGFHVSFVGVHLPAYLTDNGVSRAAAAAALSLVGGFNIVGSYLFGWLGDRYRKKYLLSAIYLGRAIVFALFFFLPLSQTSALLFGAAIGFLWLATVPLTSGTVAQIFGMRYLSTLYGIVFLSHQIGGFLGVWLAGRLYDTTGTYDLIWYLAMALGLFAAFVHMPISDAPLVQSAVERPQLT